MPCPVLSPAAGSTLLSNAWWGSKFTTGLTPVSYAACCAQCKTTQGCTSSTRCSSFHFLWLSPALAASPRNCCACRQRPVPCLTGCLRTQALIPALQNTCYLYTAATASASRLNKLATTTSP